MFHELGHMFQDDVWTWEGTGEVTVNIFTLHAMEVICGIKPWLHPWFEGFDCARKYFQSGPTYEAWKSQPRLALYMYAQLARDFSWESFKTVFLIYNHMPEDEKPSDDIEKLSKWIVVFSQAVNHNLCPFYEFWGLPVEDYMKKMVEHLTPYQPIDEITTEIAVKRSREILHLDL